MPATDQPSPPPATSQPVGLVTLDALLEDLYADDIVTEASVISLLGDQRKSPSVNVLEIALVRNNVLSREALLARKARLGGLPAYPDEATTTTTHLPHEIAIRAGAIALNLPTPTLAMVEPTPANLRMVADALGTTKFQVWLTTAPHFAELVDATYRGGAAVVTAEPVPDLYTILDTAISRRASDIHLKVGEAPSLRVDGAMHALDYQVLDRQWLRHAVESIASDRHLAELERKFSSDFAYSFGAARFRVNSAHDAEGPTMVLRRLPTTLPTANELDLPNAIRKFAELERGLVLVTGPTGSGKSTTLAAVLNEIINNSARHVITLEDPIEFKFPTARRSLVNQRELGTSFATFPDGIRDALRQDPDVMLVGEMRDRETISAAIELADTGHLVFGTLHTADAPSSVERIVGVFPPDEQESIRVKVARLLRGCVSQTLLPRATGRGRVAAFEILVTCPAIQTNLRKADGMSQLKQTMQTSADLGMVTMEQSLAVLASRGVVSRGEAEFRAGVLEDFHQQLTHLARN